MWNRDWTRYIQSRYRLCHSIFFIVFKSYMSVYSISATGFQQCFKDSLKYIIFLFTKKIITHPVKLFSILRIYEAEHNNLSFPKRTQSTKINMLAALNKLKWFEELWVRKHFLPNANFWKSETILEIKVCISIYILNLSYVEKLVLKNTSFIRLWAYVQNINIKEQILLLKSKFNDLYWNYK